MCILIEKRMNIKISLPAMDLYFSYRSIAATSLLENIVGMV